MAAASRVALVRRFHGLADLLVSERFSARPAAGRLAIRLQRRWWSFPATDRLRPTTLLRLAPGLGSERAPDRLRALPDAVYGLPLDSQAGRLWPNPADEEASGLGRESGLVSRQSPDRFRRRRRPRSPSLCDGGRRLQAKAAQHGPPRYRPQRPRLVSERKTDRLSDHTGPHCQLPSRDLGHERERYGPQAPDRSACCIGSWGRPRWSPDGKSVVFGVGISQTRPVPGSTRFRPTERACAGWRTRRPRQPGNGSPEPLSEPGRAFDSPFRIGLVNAIWSTTRRSRAHPVADSPSACSARSRFRVDGEPVELPRRTHQVLLTLLLLRAGEVVSRDKLIDQLWGENPPRTAVGSLQNFVSELRRNSERTSSARTPPVTRSRSSASASTCTASSSCWKKRGTSNARGALAAPC